MPKKFAPNVSHVHFRIFSVTVRIAAFKILTITFKKQPGTDVTILKIFSPKTIAKKFSVFDTKQS
jgi:hypothetical protein